MPANLHEIDTYAQKWVKEAGERIRASFPKTLNIQTKSNPNDLVTDIDQATEQYFIEKIRSTFPEHRILGEEGYGDKLEDLSGVVWIIDPIDGTMNFVHQQRNFAISVGIYEDGGGKIGLIYDVVHDELYHVIKGNGVDLNGQKIPRLEETTVSKAIIALNSTWVMENKRIDHQLLIPLAKDVRGTRSYGSAAMELVYVATGRIDAYISLRLAPWDFAAGILMIEELGGVTTNLRGEKLSLLEQNSVFVAKPGLHREIMNNYLHGGNW
ncbi:inositol monophosphatase family protein [Bacillus sp. T33-2]|uniref:inositol monophosphatase family protein n=1 Tax=Bacillus sp. T33-2 TaxID=2054168 RepID=UPI000C77E899|nr:inositol monophosphatase family protein [Bacillus sp. T33-2]PLR97433.1 inositol monophosphatase [Bacillus sp. T33-2]